MAADRERARPTAYGLVVVALFAVGPFLGFAQRNAGQITQWGRLALYAVLAAFLSMGALALVVRRRQQDDSDRVAVVVGAIVATFLGYSSLFDPDPSQTSKLLVSLGLWALLTGVLVRAAQVLGGDEHARLAVLVFAGVLVAVPAVEVAAGTRGADPSVEVLDPGTLRQPAERPNVYWILLDTYARPDILQEVANIDVDPFVDELEDQGFTVSTSSRTSYPRTILSLASTLQMQYVLEPGHDVTDEFQAFAPVVVGHSSTTARFEALGYQTVYGPAGGLEWSACRPDLVDACLPLRRPPPSTGELEQALLELTPLGALSLPVPYSDPQTLLEGLADPDLDVEPPFFAFQHILTPHAPYRYRADCSARAVPEERTSKSVDVQRTNYGTQIRCINDLVLRATADIVERDPTAIVIVQSDHGPELSSRWFDGSASWPIDQAQARYAAFNAMRLPSHCQDNVEGASLVNTFRIVFACIEGHEPILLDYRAFTYPWRDVAALVELTPAHFGEWK